MRLSLRVAGIAAGFLLCVPLHYLCRLLRLRSPWARFFLAWAGRSAGLRVRTEGTPLRCNVLFVSNHVSWLDIFAIGGATGAAFVSRDDVGSWPVAGWAASLNDTIYVARHARREVHGQADEIRRVLAGGRAVALFPEGTTGDGRALLPFRASLLASLFPPLAGVRVQPVALDYGAAAPEIAWAGEEGAGANAKRVLSRRGILPVVLRFLEPIDPASEGDRKALAGKARQEIANALPASEPIADPL